MFSVFWEEAFVCFSLLTPVMHVTINMAAIPLLGQVFSHGFLVSGYLPVRVAFPSMARILLGPMVEIPSQILVETFTESLCSFEATTIKKALDSTTFSNDLKTSHGNFESCWVQGLSSSLRARLSDVAKYKFQTN